MAAELELRKLVGDRHKIVVLDPRPDFTFLPSLIWLPFGLRDAGDVTFPLAPMYRKKGIRFIKEAATQTDPAAHTVTTTAGEELAYDRLLIGTRPAAGVREGVIFKAEHLLACNGHANGKVASAHLMAGP